MVHPGPLPASSWLPLAFLLVLSAFAGGIVPSLASSGGGADDHHAGQNEVMMMDRFHAWMEEHGRSYPTVEEKLRRFDIFRDNMEFVEAVNRHDGDTPCEQIYCDQNQFSDLTHEEFLAMYTSRHSLDHHDDGPAITTRAGEVTEGGGCSLPKVGSLPESVDWRAKNAVTPAKDQLHLGCNACWVFASVATIESAYKIKRPSTRKLLNLSEQEIVDCTTNGCGGGSLSDAFKLAKIRGMAKESEYGPFTAKEGVCRMNEVPASVWVKEYRSVRKNCEYDLAVAVASQPVAVLFDADDRCFQCYKRGIYSAPPGDNLDHSLAIVGYGKDATTGKNYWIAKNSWGDKWGQDGFVYIEKDLPDNPKGTRGLAVDPQYPIVY